MLVVTNYSHYFIDLTFLKFISSANSGSCILEVLFHIIKDKLVELSQNVSSTTQHIHFYKKLGAVAMIQYELDIRMDHFW